MIFIKRFKIEYAFKNKFIVSISWIDWFFLKAGKYRRLHIKKCIEKQHISLSLNFSILIIIAILFSPAQNIYGFSFFGIRINISILDKKKILIHNILQSIK